jgi:transposase-like protein
VATLQRDFEQTLVYYSLPAVAREWIRTTSLEDANQSAIATQVSPGRHLWQSQGAEVAIYLQVQRLHAHWTDESWWETSHALYFALWNLNP